MVLLVIMMIIAIAWSVMCCLVPISGLLWNQLHINKCIIVGSTAIN